MKKLLIIFVFTLALASCKSDGSDPIPTPTQYNVRITGIRYAPNSTENCIFTIESTDGKTLPKSEITDLCSKYTMLQEITIAL